ncbi:MAG: ribosomal protein S18-alanine N-acetyltransferase [Nitrospirota bacterium]
MEITISEMGSDDLTEVMELEREIFSWPWTEELFLDELNRDYSFILLAREPSGFLVGFICFWMLIDEMHILNLGVRTRYRRLKVASKLVREGLRFCYERGARAATLEVREKNHAAISLYKSMGFQEAGLRKNYYESPGDNAVIMWLSDIRSVLEKSP